MKQNICTKIKTISPQSSLIAGTPHQPIYKRGLRFSLGVCLFAFFTFASLSMSSRSCGGGGGGSSTQKDPWAYPVQSPNAVSIRTDNLPFDASFILSPGFLTLGTYGGPNYSSVSCFSKKYPLFFDANYFAMSVSGGSDLNKYKDRIYVSLEITPFNEKGESFASRTFWWPEGQNFNSPMQIPLPSDGSKFICKATMFEIVTRCASRVSFYPVRRFIVTQSDLTPGGITIHLDFAKSNQADFIEQR